MLERSVITLEIYYYIITEYELSIIRLNNVLPVGGRRQIRHRDPGGSSNWRRRQRHPPIPWRRYNTP